jgi:predicted  nucleic acid-binding Zn-ribbon protein
LKLFYKIKFFVTSFFLKSKSKNIVPLKVKIYDLHGRVFSLEQKLQSARDDIKELTDLINKISKVQYDLANSYNNMAGDLYSAFEKEVIQSQTGMILFGLDDDDDDLIN